MKQHNKRLIALLCCLSMLPLSACGDTPNGPTADPAGQTVVWTASGAEKFMRDADYSAYHSSKTLKISAFRNEREAAQMMITAAADGNYVVEISDLHTKDGDVLPKESFSIYHEKYIQIDTIYDAGVSTPAGEYPDALLPYENAVEYQENYVKNGKNQGIWVELLADETQEAGD